MGRIFTSEGLEKLKAELEERKTKIRHEIADSIKEAKEQGDLSENAEYSEAKHHQNENESRIAELEGLIKEAIVAARESGSSTVSMGSVVTIKCTDKEMRFEIVGSNEVDPAGGKISSESPIGKALMGKTKGDNVEIDVPVGKMKCVIVSVA